MKLLWPIIIVASIGLPAGYATMTADDVGVVTGHTVFVDIVRYDDDLAAIAGIANQKVVWFNGVIVMDKKEQGWVYAAEAGSPDPSKERLAATGQFFNFTDPNGGEWSVQEFYFMDVPANFEAFDLVPEELLRTHAWTVKVATDPIWDPTLARDYNFVTIVDTTKVDNRQDGAIQDPGHDGDGPHGHSSAQVDLWFRTIDPVSICVNCGGGAG